MRWLMGATLTRIVVWASIAVLACLPVISLAQCLPPGADLLVEEDFEQGWPAGWEAPEGSWKTDSSTIGLFPNPGQGAWMYAAVTAPANRALTLLSPEWDISPFGFSSFEISFDLFLKTYQGNGIFTLEIRKAGTWHQALLQTEDFSGRISLSLSDWTGETLQFRFAYLGDGRWGWGAGIDRLWIAGLASACGNGTCDPWESPSGCPPDCRGQNPDAPAWVPLGKDLSGNQVNYTRYLRGTGCDDCSEEVNLGFSFDLYGNAFTRAYLNANGNLTFGAPSADYTPQPFCLLGPKMVAPFYADIDLTYGGRLDHYSDPEGHYFIATWTSAPYYGCRRACALFNSFQVILTDGTVSRINDFLLPPGANVLFNYRKMEWTTAESGGGINGFGGLPAIVGLNQGDGANCSSYGRFYASGHLFFGPNPAPDCPPGGIEHLNGQTICFHGVLGEVLTERPSILVQVNPRDRSNLLRWFLASRKDKYWFAVQRSSDSLLFQTIQTLSYDEAQDPQEGAFQFLDHHLPPGRVYYRIEVTDSAAGSWFSPVIAATGAASAAPGLIRNLRAFPNPFQESLILQVEGLKEMGVWFTITDMQGKPVISGSWPLREGPNERRLSLPNLPSGMYMLSVQGPDYTLFERLLKP